MNKPKEKFLVIEFRRHGVFGGIRRAPGQTVRISTLQMKQQGLKKGDFKVVR